jgi:hypothetical protein
MDGPAVERDPHELEVIGGYDVDVGPDSLRRPLPEWDVAAVKALTSRDQVRRYLLSLPDDFLIKTYRHIQFRLRDDGTVWDCYGFASVRRVAEGPEPADIGQVTPLPEVDPQSAEDYARGWRPLGPPKVTDNPCQACGGHGICGNCMGSGQG